MIRSATALLLLLGLLLPAGAAAQTAGQDERGSSAVGAETQIQVFMGTFRAVRDLHLGSFPDSILWQKAVEGLLRELDDPYAAVFTPDEFGQFEEETTGNYAGIGVQITQLNEDITITAVFRGTPAEGAGLQVGDRIVAVDEETAEEWTVEDASQRIRGPAGTAVRVTVERSGYPAPIPLRIERDDVHISAVTAGFLPDSVAYIQLDRVARGAAQELDSALVEVEGARGLIVDLRRNPGGYLDESLYIADLFLPRGVRLASTRSRAAPGDDAPAEAVREDGLVEETFDSRIPPRLPDLPIVILVDEFTASAAEIFAGALQDHDRALVIGERTFGKGVVQQMVPLVDGYQLRLTTGSWHTPLGRSLQRPRDRQGRPIAEDPDTFPTLRTEAGRELVSGGGIFPDLEVGDDTLRTAERELIAGAARDSVPLPLRIQEFAFTQAQELRRTGADPAIEAEAFDEFLQGLRDEGLDPELLEDPVAREYLLWRARVNVALRMGLDGAATEVRMDRDPVLSTAVSLLRESPTQSALFDRAVEERELGSERAAREGGGPTS